MWEQITDTLVAEFSDLPDAGQVTRIVLRLLIAAALGSVAGAWEFLVMALGPAYLTTLMVFAARDADHTQLERYGNDAAYQSYRGRTGTFLPGL